MNLSDISAEELGRALERGGWTWKYDSDGDVQIGFRTSQSPWIDALHYELQENFTIQGQFLNAQAIPQGDGHTVFEVPPDCPYEPVALGQKVVNVYLTPRPGSVSIQIHAGIALLNQGQPLHIKVVPSEQQIQQIASMYPGFSPQGGGQQLWFTAAAAGDDIEEPAFWEMTRSCSSIGFAMFEGPFTGTLHTAAL